MRKKHWREYMAISTSMVSWGSTSPEKRWTLRNTHSDSHWAEKPSLPRPYPPWVSLGQRPSGPLLCPSFTEELTGERGSRHARMASPLSWCAEVGTYGPGPSQNSLPAQGTAGRTGLAEVIPLMTMNWNTEEKDLRRCSPPSYSPGFSVGALPYTRGNASHPGPWLSS